ncbi:MULTISPECIES: helix-turn-helix domain-containing protein [Cyanophyceae]|uniref:helix-turn-helix domain-containing protein n=1 Tax=Cyanophyceae TaxID=3028117 RepID=UPI0016862F76|nr:helix-turn-helix transcriptional regulator [Trichocoleus sp. FACHB-40]MBD2007000.1 XRE family transcriptional regulator [Trichocoleus sp. FACHB-40]
MTTNPRIGSSLDDLLEEDGVLEEVEAVALKRVVAWKVSEIMREKGISKAEMAAEMKTSRASLNRFLDPQNPSVTLHTLVNAAKAIGGKLCLDLVLPPSAFPASPSPLVLERESQAARREFLKVKRQSQAARRKSSTLKDQALASRHKSLV